MSKTIFITGGTGFLGAYLLRYLVKGSRHTIRALKRKNSSMLLVKDIQDKIEWIEGDVLDNISLEDAMQDVDEVYHCAAVVSFDPKLFPMMHRVNQEGTANVVNTALHLGIKKLVHISSIAALGRFKHISFYDEKVKWDRSPLNSQYAISKYGAEQEVWRGVAEGLNAAVVSPSVIIGSGIWGAGTTTFFDQIWNGLKFYPAGATGFVDVRDVAKFTIQLMESDISNERFVLNGDNWSYRQLFIEIAKATGKKVPTIQTNSLMNGLAWRGDWLRSLLSGKKRLITKEIATHVNRKYTYGNQKSSAFFDFEYTPIRQTLLETSEQYIQSKEQGKAAAVLPLL